MPLFVVGSTACASIDRGVGSVPAVRVSLRGGERLVWVAGRDAAQGLFYGREKFLLTNSLDFSIIK